MKTLTTTMEETFVDIALAEEREVNYRESAFHCFTEWLDSYFTAITLAETGEFGTVRDLTGGGSGDSRRSVENHMFGFCAGSA